MPIININDVGKYGVVATNDATARHLPLGAWTHAKNVAFKGDRVERATLLTNAPDFVPAFAVKGIFDVLGQDGYQYWVFAGEDAVFASPGLGTSDGDITGATAPYNASEWNGGVFNNLLVINPIAMGSNPVMGVGAPQLWSPVDPTVILVNLTNWPANTKCRVIRPFKAFLMALGVQKPGPVNYTRMVKWSHSADTGVPSTWDPTDATKDAGENNLPYGSTPIIDGVELGEVFVIYTDDETWMMSLSSVGNVFAFRRMFVTSGVLAQDCAVNLFPGKHFVVTHDDIIIHDLYNQQSIIDKKLRNSFFNSLSNVSYFSRVAVDTANKDVWVMYSVSPTDGTPTQALVWSYKYDSWSKRDIPTSRALYTSPTHLSLILRGNRKGCIVLGSEASPYVYQTGLPIFTVNTNTAELEREDICVLAGSGGQIVVDPNVKKLVRAIWPRFKTGSDGSVLTLTLYSRDQENGTWVSAGSAAYSPTTSEKVDLYAEGRFFKVGMSISNNYGSWELHSYGLDVEPLGGR